jgi:hypothetical protein
MRVAAIEWCYHIPNLQVYLFRRIYDDVERWGLNTRSTSINIKVPKWMCC